MSTIVHVLLSTFPWDSSFPAHCRHLHPDTVLGLCRAGLRPPSLGTPDRGRLCKHTGVLFCPG